MIKGGWGGKGRGGATCCVSGHVPRGHLCIFLPESSQSSDTTKEHSKKGLSALAVTYPTLTCRILYLVSSKSCVNIKFKKFETKGIWAIWEGFFFPNRFFFLI